ncbi:MAG: 1-deoxy-D-xylulose-5-phosphate reductoisomerase [bacterium]
MKKKISILGSTGSIGKQALEVIDSLPDNFQILGLAGGENIEILQEQIKKYKPKIVSVKNEKLAIEFKKQIKDTQIVYGKQGLIQIAQNTENDLILVAVSGLVGLFPVLAAIDNNINLALANKEILVSAGKIIMKRAKEKNIKILPVDSEHSAIHQCINSRNSSYIKKLIITGSGGPFKNKSMAEMENASVEETLKHPKWSMGSKITVDSATLMNKGLEAIEAHWLFGLEYQNIEVIIHPQSIIHGAVEFLDGSIIAQLGVASMHIPIQYALTYPEKYSGLKTNSLNLSDIGRLEFEKPALNRFPCLKLAYEAGIKGGTYPAVLNALNEEAVYAFLNRKIKLTDISKIVEKGLEIHKNIEIPTLDDIINSDIWARELAKELI